MTAFINYNMDEGSYVSAHVLKIKVYAEQLSPCGFPFVDLLAMDVILMLFPKSLNKFMMNFMMNEWEY